MCFAFVGGGVTRERAMCIRSVYNRALNKRNIVVLWFAVKDLFSK